MDGILSIGHRRFRVPKRVNEKKEDEGEGDGNASYQDVNIAWPEANKKLCKQLQDSLSEHKIRHSVAGNRLMVQETNRLALFEIQRLIEFKIRTFNHSYTHFISIPVHQGLCKEFEEFKSSAIELVDLSKRFHQGHKSKLFTNSSKLHLTVCMLTCIGSDDIQKAASLLESINIDHPLSITLKGLDVIKGTPAAARALIAKVQESKSLHSLGEQIKKAMFANGLSDCMAPITWHCTLMNAKYYERAYGGITNCTFDARKLLRKMSFGPVQVRVDQLHLSSLLAPSNQTFNYYHSEFIKMIG